MNIYSVIFHYVTCIISSKPHNYMNYFINIMILELNKIDKYNNKYEYFAVNIKYKYKNFIPNNNQKIKYSKIYNLYYIYQIFLRINF